ncbi:MAG: hypothetical protein PF448_08740 [Bacteroidales bacterium]|jgi:hypothetical protein|nr:hypothetical protein [Bacteroidales bacterium]
MEATNFLMILAGILIVGMFYLVLKKPEVNVQFTNPETEDSDE